ncbi:MAG TPA: hypothetical protein VLD37_05140 [Candidatus Bilamarchaeum sp.]|nr:hypothetical protein [Candidatus Bilamarchaeum sp.]
MQQLTTIKKPEAQTASGFKGKAALVDYVDLKALGAKCNSEDGQLRKVAVHAPDYLTWTKETAINEVQRTHLPPPISQVKEEHGMLVNALVSEGAEVVSVKPRKEMSEGVYQRDSFAVIGSEAYAARFKHGKRAPETGVICGARNPWKAGDIIEYGDVLVFPDAVLVGLGDRTNMMAVETLRGVIGNKEIIPVPLVPGTLHLDYATTIGGRGKMRTMVACPELYQDTAQVDKLAKRMGVEHLILVPHDKHDKGWTNLFYVNPETVISTTAAHEVNARLSDIGFKVIPLSFDGILTGEGAPRCCTAPILRED